MRILHISAYAIRGGCEKACYSLIAASPEYHHQVLVLGIEGPMTAAWRELGVNVVHLDSLRFSRRKFKAELIRGLQEQYDQIIYWSSIRISTVLFSVRKATDSIVVHLGNPCQYTFLQLMTEKLNGLFYKPVKKVRFICCSQYVASSFESAGYFRNFKIDVSLNAVLIPESNPYNGSCSRQQVKIGMVARLDPIKNHALLLRAFKLATLTHPALKLHLAGSGSLMDQLVSLAVSLGIRKSVIFHGDVSDVYTFLNQLDVFVYATTINEGLGISVVEAMANGLPCILPDLPMLKELDSKERSLIWYTAESESELADQIVSLIGDSSRLESTSHLNYSHAKLTFAPAQFVHNYLNLK